MKYNLEKDKFIEEEEGGVGGGWGQVALLVVGKAHCCLIVRNLLKRN